jgi:hypothetical protein
MLKKRNFLLKGTTRPTEGNKDGLNFVTKKTPAIVEQPLSIKEQTESLFPYSVCICVTSSTDAEDIPAILDRLNTIRKMFKKSCIIYVGKHEAYTNIQNSLYVYMENASEVQMRNAYLNIVVKNKSLFDVMMVIDPHIALLRDIPQTSLDCCSRANFDSWDAAFANQSYKYYDIQYTTYTTYLGRSFFSFTKVCLFI